LLSISICLSFHPHLLQQAIETGISLASWQNDSFAYAESFDEVNERYRGLRAGSFVLVSFDGMGLIVKPMVASAQLKLESESAGNRYPTGDHPGVGPNGEISIVKVTEVEETDLHKKTLTRIYGHIETDPLRFFRVTDDLEKEILRHISVLKNAEVKLTINIDANSSVGFDEGLIRVIKENARTLGFLNIEFE
jgi:hypothetical protein